MACAYCKITHFSTCSQLQKHWKNDCREICKKTCKCKKCSKHICVTRMDKEAGVEYFNIHTINEETFFSYVKNDRRWLFFLLKKYYAM